MMKHVADLEEMQSVRSCWCMGMLVGGVKHTAPIPSHAPAMQLGGVCACVYPHKQVQTKPAILDMALVPWRHYRHSAELLKRDPTLSCRAE